MAAEIPEFYDPATGKSMGQDRGGTMLWNINSLETRRSIVTNLPVLLPCTIALLLNSNAIGAAELEEIIVTAQKREEGLQGTPISLTAFTAQAIEDKGIDSISDIAAFTPNLVFDTTSPISGLSSGAVIFIRGIGNTDFSLTTDPGVGTYVDGVYMSRSAGGVLDVLDVERVEVLRGPQGTLFGRNTIGGAINITSRKPANELQAIVDVTLGDFSRFDFRGSADLPITEEFRTSVAVSRKSRDGFVDRVLVGDKLGDEDKLSFRGTAVFEPNDNWDFQFSYDYTKIAEQSAGSVTLGFTPGASTIGYDLFRAAFAPNEPALDQFVGNPTDDITSATGPTGTDLEINGLSFITNWTRQALDAKYTFAYRETSGSFYRDPDNTPVAITHTFNPNYEHEQISHELQLTGNIGDKIQYVSGLYYLEEKGTDNVFVPIFLPEVSDPDPANWFGFPAAVRNFADIDNSSAAIYGQLTWNITDAVALTAGLRRTSDDKEFKYTQYIAADINGSPLPVPLAAVNENGDLVSGLIPIVGNGSGLVSNSFEKTTGKLGLAWTLSNGSLLYYSFSQGFKSGGFVLRYVEARPAPLTFEPEFVDAHEIGFKWQGLDNRVRLNAAAFVMDYEDVQVTFFDNLGGPITANAGTVDIQGIELEITALPTDQLLLEVGYGFTDAEYTEIIDVPLLSLTIDESAKLVNTPEHSFNLGAEYSIPIGEQGMSFRVDYSYTDDIFNDSQNSPFLFQKSYDVWNTAIRYSGAEDRWIATAFVENLADERFITSGDSNFGLGFHEANYNRPREYGIRFRISF